MNTNALRAGLLALTLSLPAAAAPIDAAETDLLLDRLIAGTAQYQDPAIAKTLAAGLQAERARYRQIGDDAALAQALSDDMRRLGKDKHLRVRPGGNPVPAGSNDTGRAARQAAEEAQNGYGLIDVRRLTGNVGYLRLNYFSDQPGAVQAIDAAMQLLAPTDALVIDLRQCTGGAHAALERLAGYMYPTEVQMMTIHWRRPGGITETEDQWTSRAPQPAYLERPVYLLTGARTFSAAEALVYDLRARKRAVAVGVTTRGGANPGDRPVELTRGLIALIPNGRTVHPVTGSNWEGVGIQPDVASTEADALRTAFVLAIEATSKARGKDALAEERAWAIANPDAAIGGQRSR